MKWLFSLLLLLTLAGCASVQTKVKDGRTLAGQQRFFVLSNLNDNHAIDQLITRSLKARGLTADYGPLTMLPKETQVLITYKDRWTWDFSEHLIALEIGAIDPDPELVRPPYATAAYSKHVELTTELDAVVNRIVGELLSAK